MKKFFSVLFTVAFGVFLTACNDDSSTSSGSSNVFFTAVKETAPVFDAAATKAAWSWGNPVYEIFSMFRDYDPDTDEGTIGLENIFKLMYQAGSFFDDCEARGTSIDDIAMTSPFDFGRTDNTYNKYLAEESTDRASYFATKKDGDANYGLLCWYISRSDGAEYGILQGSYNESTHDIDIDLICFVDYTGASPVSKYSLRTHLTGNSETHTFTDLRTGKWNYNVDTSAQMYCAWYNGAGVAQGTGQYSLFKVADNGSLTEPGKYFEFPADTDETYLQGISTDGLDSGDLTDGAAYLTTVDALTNFGTITDTPSDLIEVAATDFTGTGTENMKPVEMP